MYKKELENRLIAFAVEIIELSAGNQHNYAGNHLSNQKISSTISATLDYGETQSVESRIDFFHKMQIVLKDLRRTLLNIKTISIAKLNAKTHKLKKLLIESEELVSVFVKSVGSVKKRRTRLKIDNFSKDSQSFKNFVSLNKKPKAIDN